MHMALGYTGAMEGFEVQIYYLDTLSRRARDASS